MKIEFEEAPHRYRIDGEVVPSVTQCLSLFEIHAGVTPSVLEAARQFGQHGHKAMAYALRDSLDWSSLDEALKPYIQKGIGFINELQKYSTVTASECIVGDRSLKVAGTIDLIMESDRYTDLYEFKFTYAPPPTVGLQTAAYASLLRVTRPSLCKKPLRRWCVVLWESKVRAYQLVETSDWHMFLSCLNVTHWKLKHGL